MSNQDLDILFYAPFNKDDLTESNIKWLRNFQFILDISLHQLLKQKIKIANPILDDSSFSKADCDKANIVLQFYLNKNYNSEECIQNEKSNLFQILCDPELLNSPIEKTKNVRSYNFFDETKGKKIDLTSDINKIDNEIWLEFLDITYEIKALLGVNIKEESIKPKIYVAETSSDQNYNRHTIIRELIHQGFHIVPERSLPANMLQCTEEVQNSMSSSVLSIHIIGNNYAPLLENIEVSMVELQNDIFSEVVAEVEAQNKTINRLVWIPPNIKPKSEKQRHYIENFKRNIELLKNTEIIQTPIEVFKSIIQKKVNVILNKEDSLIENNLEYDSIKNSVYVIHNGSNVNRINEIIAELNKQNLNVLHTKLHKNKIELIKEHHRNLTVCDALLIIYSSDNEQWLDSKLSDVIKSPGIGRKKQYLSKAVLIDIDKEPGTEKKLVGLQVINGCKKNPSDCLKTFIEKIK